MNTSKNYLIYNNKIYGEVNQYGKVECFKIIAEVSNLSKDYFEQVEAELQNILKKMNISPIVIVECTNSITANHPHINIQLYRKRDIPLTLREARKQSIEEDSWERQMLSKIDNTIKEYLSNLLINEKG